MSKRITGRATINIDGASIPSENGAKINIGGVKRNPEVHGGEMYFSEEEMAGNIDCVVNHTADVDMFKLANISGATVLFHCDTGQKILMRGAVVTETLDLDAGKGKVGLKIAGMCSKL
jgi:hypothetical protein